MMSVCVVVGCFNSKKRKDVESGKKLRFFRIPAIIQSQGTKTYELSKARREQWLVKIKRSHEIESARLQNCRICSDHFVSGQPSALYDPNHPDWVPSLKLATGNEKSDEKIKLAYDRYVRHIDRAKKKKVEDTIVTDKNISVEDDQSLCNLGPSSGELDKNGQNVEEVSSQSETFDLRLSNPEGFNRIKRCMIKGKTLVYEFSSYEESFQQIKPTIDEQVGPSLAIYKSGDGKHIVDRNIQTEELGMNYDSIDMDNKFLWQELEPLRKKVSVVSLDKLSFQDNDSKVNIYTGFRNWSLLNELYLFLERDIQATQGLSSFEILLMTLMKLKENFSNDFLEILFKIPSNMIEEIFVSTIDLLYSKLTFSLEWPNYTETRMTLSHCCRKFFKKLAIIVDFVTMDINFPDEIDDESLKAYANVKSRSFTCVIGFTFNKKVVFISDLLFGASNQDSLLEKSKILERINPGDNLVYLKSPEGDTKEYICNDMMNKISIDDQQINEKINHTIKFHINRTTGLLKSKFAILAKSVDLNHTLGKSSLALKILKTCCALLNFMNNKNITLSTDKDYEDI